MNDTVLLCFGTRPEWLKISPLIRRLSNYKLLFTGQHIDLLKDVSVDFHISIGNQVKNRLDQLVSDCLIQFPDHGYDSVLVQGDTASAFACAIAAFHRNKKILYLEAGLRSYNLLHPYPEEGYRQMISRISDVNFCPTDISKSNLDLERVIGSNIVVGNTILDNILEQKNKANYLNKVLITMHRRENHPLMEDWFLCIEKLASIYRNIEFILPIHPNPNVIKHRQIFKYVNVIEPLNHAELINLLCVVKLVITDSGGLQEEGSFFNKKVIVCRKTTERPEGIESGHIHLCETPNLLKGLFDDLIVDYMIERACPYGDGKSSERIINFL